MINFNPLNGATGLGTNAIIEAQFSAPIDPNSLSGVTLSNGGGTVRHLSVNERGQYRSATHPGGAAGAEHHLHDDDCRREGSGRQHGRHRDQQLHHGPNLRHHGGTAINSDPAGKSTAGTNVIPKLVFNKPLNPITVNNSSFRMYLNDTGQVIPLVVTLSADGRP